MINSRNKVILASALLYGISIPVSKILLQKGVPPDMLAAFTYLGAGIGLGIYNFFNYFVLKKPVLEPLTKKELPYTAAMVLFDIAAILLLMRGISLSNSANASLLSNIEIAATSLIALVFFREYISKKLWAAVFLIISAGAVLSFEGGSSFHFSIGSLFVIAAYICWGAENNCTKMISSKNTQEITMIKGIFSGLGSLIIAFMPGAALPDIFLICAVMLSGFFSYGLSVMLYIKSQNVLGAAKTAAYFSSAPFFGAAFSLLLLNEKPALNFYISLLIMALAFVLILKDTKK